MRALCAALLLASAQTYGPARLPPVPDAADPLVDAGREIPGLIVLLAYAGERNAAGRKLYAAGMPCLLRQSVTARLARAARALRDQGFRLIAYDCWRTPEAQRALWRAHPEPGSFADPRRGSLHERGVAVDVGLADLAGRPRNRSSSRAIRPSGTGDPRVTQPRIGPRRVMKNQPLIPGLGSVSDESLTRPGRRGS